MQIFKWIKQVRYLIFFLLVNVLLSFMLEPARGASEMMWAGYYAQEEIDTIFVGSSLCQGTFDPEIFDERLGTKSYNMGTPSQALPQTLKALEVALEDHDIKTVIFGMGFSSLKLDALEEAELTFERARAQQKVGLETVEVALSYLYSDDVRNDEKSINYFFPWLYNREEISLEMISYNVSEKCKDIKNILQGKKEEEYASFKGYQSPGDDVVNYDNQWELNTYRYYEPELEPEMVECFKKMLEICRRKNVDIIVVNTPHPYFDVIACYEFYESNENEVEALCEKYGASYYDFNLAKTEVYEPKATYYRDYEHLNYEGSQAFCQSMCNLMLRRENGENLDDEFYSVTEFLEIHAGGLNAWQNYYW